MRLKVLSSLADLQLRLCDSEFQTDGALTVTALAENAIAMRYVTESKKYC